jgi:hypothetical protein
VSIEDLFHILFGLVFVIHSTTFGLQTFGWTPKEAQMHMVTDYFSHSEVCRYYLETNFSLYVFLLL